MNYPDNHLQPGTKKPSYRTYSYTGRPCGPNHDVPTLQDIAVSLGRIARYAGGSVKFWPVLLHSMIVADFLPDRLKAAGLLHDSTECMVGDIPRGFKTEDISRIEDVMFERILQANNLPLLTPEDHVLIKDADNETLYGEVWTVGTPGLQSSYPKRSARAERAVLDYATKFPPETCIHPDGLAVLEFFARLRDYSDLVR